jgi:hypothetical protein
LRHFGVCPHAIDLVAVAVRGSDRDVALVQLSLRRDDLGARPMAALGIRGKLGEKRSQ